MLNIDFTNVEASNFQELKPGTYQARVAKVEEKTSQAGNPYLNWEFDVENGQGKAWYITSLLPNALWNLKTMLINAFGMDTDALNGAFNLDPTDFIGLQVTLVVETEEYNGQERARVKQVLAAR